MDTCIFCKIAEKKIPSEIVYEDAEIAAFKDIKPQAPVHIIIIPKKHIEKVDDLNNTDIELAGKLILITKKIAKDSGVSESGYRVVINCNDDGGQLVYHLHLHLVGGRKLSWPPG